MSDYPNMSYCMCQTTLLAMQQVVDAMDGADLDFLENMSREERRAFEELWQVCEAFMNSSEGLLEEIGE